MISNYFPYIPNLTGEKLRNPNAIVMFNGIRVLWTSIEVTTTTFYISDSYTVSLPLSGQPAGFDLDYLSSISPIEIKIYLGFPLDPNNFSTDDLDLFIVGAVDKLDVDPLSMSVNIQGRDYTSKFIETKTYEKYPNKTASEIVQMIAKEKGLNPVVTETTQKVGTFYTYENTLLTKETTQWDLMSFLAQQEDFVLFVSGNDLIFEPRPNTSSDPYLLNYQIPAQEFGSASFNGMELNLSRSLTLAQDVVVKVRVPYSPLSAKGATYKVSKTNTKVKNPETQTYTYTFPGLNKDQAVKKAYQILNDLTIHELKLQARLPGDNTLKKDGLIKLTGTNSSYDQLYFTDSVVRRMTVNDGYTMSINAKNHSVDSQVVL